MAHIKVEYYDNFLAVPMLICLPVGSFMLVAGFKSGSKVCETIGIILLVLFGILKIANWALAKHEQQEARYEALGHMIKPIYDDMVSDGIPKDSAKLLIKSAFYDKFMKNEIDVETLSMINSFIADKLDD